MRTLGHRAIAASLGQRHLHILCELPHDVLAIRKIIGKCKQRASHAVRAQLLGSIWSEGGEFKWIRDKRHLHNSYAYIRNKQEPGTVVWSHRPDESWIDFDVPVKIIRRAVTNTHCARIQTPVSEHSEDPDRLLSIRIPSPQFPLL